MGNCIGINRNDPETLDTGSANVTRPVTGKYHDDDLQALRLLRAPRPPPEVFSFPAGLALARSLLWHTNCKRAARTKKNLIFISLFGLSCGGCYQRGLKIKSAQNFNAVALWFWRPLTRNREARRNRFAG